MPAPAIAPPYPNSLLVPPPKLLHLNTFPYKATKQSRPIWSDSLKFIGAVKTLMWESFRSAIHKATTQKEHFWEKKNDSYNGFTGRRAAQSWRWSLHRLTVKHTSRLLISHITNTHLETNSIKGSLEVVAWIQQASIVCFPKIIKSWKL